MNTKKLSIMIKIDAERYQVQNKGIFKEILNETGKLMSTETHIDYFVQTLLSETAL
jgi:hypothetical protein